MPKNNYNNFNKKEFAFLLKKAKGNRSINKYSSDSTISAAYISRFLREKISSPPTPETISKLSKTAQNGVSYGELMVAAGHIYSIHEAESRILNKEKEEEIKKEIFSTFISALYSSNYRWSIKKESLHHTYTYLKLTTDKDHQHTWNITFKTNITPETIVYIYGHLSILDPDFQSKMSIVIVSEEEFNLFVKTPPKALNINFSVILLDMKNKKIIEEKTLSEFSIKKGE